MSSMILVVVVVIIFFKQILGHCGIVVKFMFLAFPHTVCIEHGTQITQSKKTEEKEGTRI